MREEMTPLRSHRAELIPRRDVSELLTKPLLNLFCTKSCLWTVCEVFRVPESLNESGPPRLPVAE